MVQLGFVPFFYHGMMRKISFAVDEGDQVIKHCSRRNVVQGADAGDGVVDQALEETGNQNDIRPKRGEIGFPDACGCPSPRMIGVICRADPSRALPDAKLSWRQEWREGRPKQRQRFGKGIAGSDNDVMRPAPARDALGQTHRVAPDSAKRAAARTFSRLAMPERDQRGR